RQLRWLALVGMEAAQLLEPLAAKAHEDAFDDVVAFDRPQLGLAGSDVVVEFPHLDLIEREAPAHDVGDRRLVERAARTAEQVDEELTQLRLAQDRRRLQRLWPVADDLQLVVVELEGDRDQRRYGERRGPVERVLQLGQRPELLVRARRLA